MVISNSRILNLDIAITFQNIVVNNKNRGGGGDVLEASLTSWTIIALFLGCNGPGPFFFIFEFRTIARLIELISGFQNLKSE